MNSPPGFNNSPTLCITFWGSSKRCRMLKATITSYEHIVCIACSPPWQDSLVSQVGAQWDVPRDSWKASRYSQLARLGPSRDPGRFESQKGFPPESGSKTESLSLRPGSRSGRFTSTFFPLFDVYTLDQKPKGKRQFRRYRRQHNPTVYLCILGQKNMSITIY